MTAVRLTCAGFGLVLLMAASTEGVQAGGRMSYAQVRQEIIRESVRANGGYCVCPWQKDRKGKLCGSRSLYNKEGITPPQCYAKDVDEDSVEAWLNDRYANRR